MVNFKIRLGLLSLLLLVGCTTNTYPSFVNLPTGASQLPTQQNVTADVPQELQDEPVTSSVEKECWLQNYQYLNKLCFFPSFWEDFSNFWKKWVSYKTLLLIIAIGIIWMLVRKFWR